MSAMVSDKVSDKMSADNKKVLFIATVDVHITSFHTPYLKWFKAQGWETFVAANSGANLSGEGSGAGIPADGRDMGPAIIPYCDHKFNIDIQRSPFDKRNAKAYKQLKRIIRETHFNIVHCHTPMGGVLGRLAAKKFRGNGTKVLYTAHGFHFYKGAPAKNRLIYYPIEKWLAHYTDVLITINGEDYELAKAKMRADSIRLVHGVGYDEKRYYPRNSSEKASLRAEYGYRMDDILLVFVAEMNENKNQGMLIRAMREIKKADSANASVASRARLLLIGPDSIGGRYAELAKELGVHDSIDFLGYRNDADRIVAMCDIALSSSLREGLPVNVMEAMASGLPVVATNVRGNRDLVEDGVTGYLVAPGDYSSIADGILKLIDDSALHEKMSRCAVDFIGQYSMANLLPEMESIYEESEV